MRPCNEPVDYRIHKSKDDRSRVIQRKVKLLAQAGQVSGQRHEVDDEPLKTAVYFIRIREVQMSECPALCAQEMLAIHPSYLTHKYSSCQPTNVMKWYMRTKT